MPKCWHQMRNGIGTLPPSSPPKAYSGERFMIARVRSVNFVSAMALSVALMAAPAYARDGAAGEAEATQNDAAPAPDAAAQPAAEAGDDSTITVTAQRRAENIQDVPISIAAYSGDTLAAANVVTVQDLGRIAPNFQATKGAQSSFLRLNIRGIGAAGNTKIEPSVAVFVDGIYVPRAGAIIGALMDMQSVEVLRDPQGTLFGRNASVGALSLHTATPVNHFTAELSDRQWGVSSTLSLDLHGSTVRLINSYRDWDNDQLDGDVIFTPLPIASRTGDYRSKSQNHELQFVSPTRTWLNGHLDMVA